MNRSIIAIAPRIGCSFFTPAIIKTVARMARTKAINRFSLLFGSLYSQLLSVSGLALRVWHSLRSWHARAWVPSMVHALHSVQSQFSMHARAAGFSSDLHALSSMGLSFSV